jgi:hypothetical protein
MQRSGGIGTGTQWNDNPHNRIASNTTLKLRTPAGLPGSPADWDASIAPAKSHYARSQELIYLRPRVDRNLTVFRETPTTTYATTGANDTLGIKKMSNVDLKANNPSGDPVPDIIPAPLYLRLANTALGYDMATPILWQTMSLSWTPTTATTMVPSQIPVEALREFSLVVVPSPTTGRGQLVRAVKMTAAGGRRVISTAPSGATMMVVDKVLSECVDRVVFNTYRSSTKVELGQIRVKLFLSKDQPGYIPLAMTSEFAVGIRSTGDNNSMDSLRQAMGSAGSGTASF